jgi:hypothetical protein
MMDRAWTGWKKPHPGGRPQTFFFFFLWWPYHVVLCTPSILFPFRFFFAFHGSAGGLASLDS